MNTIFEIHFTDRSVLLLEGADAYQPEGAMTTFFASGSSRSTIDSWSTRVASFRSGDINSVQRSSSGASAMVDLRDTEAAPLVPIQTVPIQSVPIQSVPIQTLPTETVPTETVPTETVRPTMAALP